MTATTLAQASNMAVYASMLVLTFALISFAIGFAARGKRVDAPVAQVPAMAAAGSASGQVLVEDAPDTGASVQPDEPGGLAASDSPVVEAGRRAGNIGMSFTWLAWGLLLLGVVLRGLWAGRVPWGNMYEFSLTSSLGILTIFLAFSIKRDVRWLGLFVSAAVLLTLGLAVTVLYTEAAQLVPALKSWWLLIHVSAAIIAGGGFTIAFGTTLLYLWRDRAEQRGGPVTGFAAKLPDAARLDALSYRIIAFAFPVWTFAVISGAIWAENAWGRYWGWDPKETWAFITWVIYAGYLHARATAGWRGRRAAYISLVGFAAFLINYFGVNLFASGLHSYSGM